MTFSDWVKSIFRRSSTPSANDVSARLYNAIGPRMKVGSIVRVSNTGSMNFPEGTLFKIESRDFFMLEKDDLILRYDERRQLNTLHRVISDLRRAGNGEYYYVTKGDNNAERDSNMAEKEYIGVAVQSSLPLR